MPCTKGNIDILHVIIYSLYILSGYKKDNIANVQAVDVDGDDTSIAEIRQLKKQKKLVICYISVGSIEQYRSDAYVSH